MATKAGEKIKIPEGARKVETHKSQINFPMPVWDGVEDWLEAHPGHTLHSLLFNGLKAVGVPVEDEYLTPKTSRTYRRGWSRKKKEDGDD